jgi:D-lactate dehydrogenase
MRIAFFEVQDWEKELLQNTFPDAMLVKDSLTTDNAGEYQDIEVISPFIYSLVSRDVLMRLPNLKCIATRSTGYDHIDVATCKERNIVVTNVPEYGSRTVAEYTFALILALSRKIIQSVNQSKEGNIDHNATTGFNLFGKTLGLVGMGKIAMEVLKIAQGFNMNAIAYARTPHPELTDQYHLRYADLETVLKESDIVSLHVPYTKETHHIINGSNIEFFKKDALLINTARGGLVQTEALLKGLEKGVLGGVALDVLEEEKQFTEEAQLLSSLNNTASDFKTLLMDHMLIRHPKVIITPHNAFNSREALMQILTTTIENIHNFQRNSPSNVIE